MTAAPNILLRDQYGISEQANCSILGGSSQIRAAFTVASTDAAGFGITGLGGYGVAAAYMHTAETPGAGNPNPAAGYLMLKLALNYAGFWTMRYSLHSPNSGSNINVTAGLTVGQLYVITAVGTTTASQWQTLGLPTGIVPAVGAVFIASTASDGSGTGVVQIPKASGSGVSRMEIVGTPGSNVNPTDKSGSQIFCQFLAPAITLNSYTPAGTNNSASPPIFTGTPAVLTGTAAYAVAAPADGTIVNVSLSMNPLAGPLI